ATGHAAATTLLGAELRRATPAEAEALRLGSGLVVAVERVRYADGLPLSLDSARFPAALVPDLLAQPLEESLYVLLDAVYGLRPEVTEEQITVVRADQREAGELAVPVGSPLLHVARVAATADGVPFEMSDDLFRADRVRLVARRTTRPATTERGGTRADDGVIEIGLGD
ncbi:MAG TPA: GntR family transcriptional regulator, partial [Nocardioides sp.]